jgi:hypothetical protein
MSDLNPPSRATPPSRPSDELVLAALERAACHQARDSPAVPAWAIYEHLALPRRSAATRHVGSRLPGLRAAGWLERSRRHGVDTWALTSAGEEHLRRARHAGELAQLPESPQHTAWRLARTTAEEEIDRFRGDLGGRLRQATLLLEADPPAHSDAWFALAEELGRACQRLASASHCLFEWAEPSDARADVDERLDPADQTLEPAERARWRARRAGRRNVRLWDRRAGG